MEVVNRNDTCPSCGEDRVKVTRPERFRYRMSGLEHVYLAGGVTRFECASCGEATTLIEGEHQLMELLALGLLLKPAMLSGLEMRLLRKACRLNQEELARRLGITRRAIIAREKKSNPGLKIDQELGLRVVLAGGFKARLDRDGSHLGKSHLKQLDGVVAHLARLALEHGLATRTQRTTLSRDRTGRSWRFTESGSLAA